MKPDLPKMLADLGGTVRDVREENEMTQTGLASACDLHRTHIAGIEKGRLNITLESLAKVAHALKVKPSQLLSRAKW